LKSGSFKRAGSKIPDFPDQTLGSPDLLLAIRAKRAILSHDKTHLPTTLRNSNHPSHCSVATIPIPDSGYSLYYGHSGPELSLDIWIRGYVALPLKSVLYCKFCTEISYDFNYIDVPKALGKAIESIREVLVIRLCDRSPGFIACITRFTAL
jgi:hypothetical protein